MREIRVGYCAVLCRKNSQCITRDEVCIDKILLSYSDVPESWQENRRHRMTVDLCTPSISKTDNPEAR